MITGAITGLHIALLGDEIRAGGYIPYGKQLVRQLMSSGLYAAARSVSPADGILVEARISGTQRWIRITALECKAIFMDSGIAGLHNIGLQNPALTGKDGTLHYGTTIRAYLPQKKLLGLILPPSTACEPSVELDATRAYEVKVVDGVRDPEGEALLAIKKSFTARMPASIFTGKLRLWVQAQYGRPLYEWKLQPNWQNAPPSWDLMTETGGESYLFQIHSSHTGIVTDDLKRHWLVQFGMKGAYPDSGKVNLFLMRVNPCVEKLRSNLLDTSTLSNAEKERIETYILAYSTPDYESCITLNCSIPVSSGLAYGWHFNWNGSKSDIIGIATRDLGGGVYDYRSTHYRINIARNAGYIDEPGNTAHQNEARRWKAELETVEVSGYWRNGKWIDVIAVPEWSEQALLVTGTVLGGSYGVGAPFYCFYTRDILKVARYTKTGGESVVDYMLSSSPAYFGGNFGWGSGMSARPCDLVTLGTEGGVSELRTRTTTPTVASFTIGEAVLSVTADSYSFGKISCSQKALGEASWYGGGAFEPVIYVPVGDPAGATFSTLGCLVTYGDHPLLQFSVPSEPSMFPAPAIFVEANYTGITVSGTHSEGHNTLCAIPFGDSEAAYIWARKFTSDSESGTSGSYDSQSHVGANRLTNYDNTATYYRWDYNKYAVTLYGGTTAVSSYQEQYNVLGSVCVSNAGTKNFTTENVVSAFFAGGSNSLVQQTFWTTTSAGLDAAIKGAGIPLTDGYITDGVFMGWA